MVQTIDAAVAFVITLLDLPGSGVGEKPLELEAEQVTGTTDIHTAIIEHDTPALYRLLMAGFSYQGITDKVARNFIAAHGNADWEAVRRLLVDQGPRCPKLAGHHCFHGCGYKKTSARCGNPDALQSCPIPALPLRKGVLNEQAFSLYFLLRDVCGNDLVEFVDAILAIASLQPDRIIVGREALVALLTQVSGVSRKLACMMLASLLECAGPDRPKWLAVGQSMVAIDSLVHNFLHRTGILRAYVADHPYGQRCVGANGCEHVIRDLASRLAEQADLTTSATPISPRNLQHAIWRFCAADERAICNGNTIRDSKPCELVSCPLRPGCGLIALRTPSPAEDTL